MVSDKRPPSNGNSIQEIKLIGGTIMDIEAGEINNNTLCEEDGMLQGGYSTTSLETQA